MSGAAGDFLYVLLVKPLKRALFYYQKAIEQRQNFRLRRCTFSGDQKILHYNSILLDNVT